MLIRPANLPRHKPAATAAFVNNAGRSYKQIRTARARAAGNSGPEKTQLLVTYTPIK